MPKEVNWKEGMQGRYKEPGTRSGTAGLVCVRAPSLPHARSSITHACARHICALAARPHLTHAHPGCSALGHPAHPGMHAQRTR
eukprot:366232-Chlamydomonas_euryale.AAC.28